MHASCLQRPSLMPQSHGTVTASCWLQVRAGTSAEARANWTALWEALGRSDTALIFHMCEENSRDRYVLVHAARRYYVEIGMPWDMPMHRHRGCHMNQASALVG